MDGSTTERKNWSPEESKRGLECRYCGCRHFRVTCLPARLPRRGGVGRQVYTRPGWGGELIRHGSLSTEAGSCEALAKQDGEGGYRHCGKSKIRRGGRPQDVPSGRVTTWERPIRN